MNIVPVTAPLTIRSNHIDTFDCLWSDIPVVIEDHVSSSQEIIVDGHFNLTGRRISNDWGIYVAKRSHDRSNTILDRTDVMDERTGTRYNISVTPNGNYNWIDGLGNIVATQSNSAPGPFFHQLTDLP